MPWVSGGLDSAGVKVGLEGMLKAFSNLADPVILLSGQGGGFQAPNLIFYLSQAQLLPKESD